MTLKGGSLRKRGNLFESLNLHALPSRLRTRWTTIRLWEESIVPGGFPGLNRLTYRRGTFGPRGTAAGIVLWSALVAQRHGWREMDWTVTAGEKIKVDKRTRATNPDHGVWRFLWHGTGEREAFWGRFRDGTGGDGMTYVMHTYAHAFPKLWWNSLPN